MAHFGGPFFLGEKFMVFLIRVYIADLLKFIDHHLAPPLLLLILLSLKTAVESRKSSQILDAPSKC
ncbi:MAG: hypothetical protein ACJAUP_003647 [Cellvibrionaceae bacterium]|jgi:hypothetical protein